MKVTVEFEDSNNIYHVDFLKLAKQLNLTEEQIKQVINDLLSKNG